MSEVYIRSQNKEKLYRLGGNYACVEYGEYEDIKKKRGGAEADKKRHVICISDGCLEEIGEYATKERCLEVLDEIQKACVSYLFTAGGAAVISREMQARTYLGLDTVGVAEFFALLYIAYEVVSIFKNMALCGLPVKKVWEKVREFLAKYTDELPDTDELDGDRTTGNVEEHRTQER